MMDPLRALDPGPDAAERRAGGQPPADGFLARLESLTGDEVTAAVLAVPAGGDSTDAESAPSAEVAAALAALLEHTAAGGDLDTGGGALEHVLATLRDATTIHGEVTAPQEAMGQVTAVLVDQVPPTEQVPGPPPGAPGPMPDDEASRRAPVQLAAQLGQLTAPATDDADTAPLTALRVTAGLATSVTSSDGFGLARMRVSTEGGERAADARTSAGNLGGELLDVDAGDAQLMQGADAARAGAGSERSSAATSVRTVGFSSAVQRVLEAVERLEHAPPPKQLTLELGEVRLRVALEDGHVRLSLQGASSPDADAALETAEDELARRGFDLDRGSDQRAQDGGQGDRDDQPGAAPATPSADPARRRRAGLRL